MEGYFAYGDKERMMGWCTEGGASIWLFWVLVEPLAYALGGTLTTYLQHFSFVEFGS